MAEPSDNEELCVRLTAGRSRAEEWALVLASAGIAYRLLERDGAFALVVSVRDAAAAGAALAAFDAESAVAAAPPAPAPDLGPSALGVAFAALLLAFFAVAGPWEAAPPSAWFRVGTANAELILRGQWWRAVTALTLHADVMHLASNAIAGLLLASAVGRWLGPGLGGTLILATAGGANLLVALAHRAGHLSVGASTATFAALGILTGLQIVRRVQLGASGKRAWLPLAVGLALFAMLGVGGGKSWWGEPVQMPSQPVDVLAHLFGLGAGAVGGVAVGVLGVRAPGRIVQGVLSVLALAAIAGCWALAFRVR